jgi:hypothetical protein
MADEKKIKRVSKEGTCKVYDLNVAELDKVLEVQKEVRVNVIEAEREMVLFEIKRVKVDGRVHDNNNVFC